jgi:F0F1-type ATP synthase membrane subunit c/vacuolar-type H+-ATPase subunit K
MEPAATATSTILLGKYIGAGLATLGMLGAAIGVGIIFSAALQGIARNPAKEGSIKGFALLGMALAEFMGLLAFVVAILILYVVKE